MNNDQPRRGGFKDAWHRFDSRFFIGRWIILILLTLMLLTCTYYTIKVKTSNIANLKATYCFICREIIQVNDIRKIYQIIFFFFFS